MRNLLFERLKTIFSPCENHYFVKNIFGRYINIHELKDRPINISADGYLITFV